MMPRRLVAGCTANYRGLCFIPLVLLMLLTGTGEVRGHVSEPSSRSSDSVRTVMDLMEVMLNRNILDMLKNGGFDFREPARIFLPPKFYSIVPLDPGHMSLEQILTADRRKGTTGPSLTVPLPSSVAFGGKADQQQPHKPDGAVAGDKPRGVVSVSDDGGGSRINLISYSDGKVTTAGGGGSGVRRPAVTNKGSETLEKNVATNGLAGALVPAMVRTNFQERINAKEMTPANEQKRWQPSLTTSITDQTVSQNVGRTLPTSGRAGGLGESGGSSTTDRLRSALPGEPDVDYPILGSVPTTQFSCDKRHHGYYADVEARCQVFRVCANTDSTGRGFAFLCPNGTLFNQRHLVCDWYMNVRCEESESLYHVNEAIGRMAGGRPMVSDNPRDMMSVVMSMVTYPMRSLMDMMDGVGVIEERFEGGEQERPQQQVKVSPSPGRSDGYVTPGTGLEPPFTQANVRYSGDLDDYSPEVIDNVAGVGTPVGPQADQAALNVYRPKLDNVYVSSLGTLSTDTDSGFDPVRSTLLTQTAGGVTQLAGGPQADSYGVSNVNQARYSTPVATDIQLVKADLVHSWYEQPTTLKLTPVSRTFAQQTTTPQHTPFRPHHQTTHSVVRQGSILPPTGVLPPSTLTRTVSIGGNRKYADPSSASSGHRFAPVRKVLPIQTVTVVPENSYQMQTNSYTQAQNLFPTTYSTHSSGFVPVQPTYVRAENLPYSPHSRTHASVSHQHRAQQVSAAYNRFISSTPYTAQLLRRSDVLSAIPASTSVSPRRYKATTVLQVVPSLSFYLNDAQEKRAFDEAVRQGLFDERTRRAYTSYDVPLGSVGRLGRKA